MELVGGLFILFANFIELLHVLEEIWASLESNEKLGLLAITAVVRGLDSDGLGPDFLECGIIVSDKVFGGNDAGRDCVAKGMQLNSLMRLEVLLSKEDIKIGVLLD